MDHASAQQSFSDYWDGSLLAAARQQVAEHLGGCADCRREYEAFERAMAPLGRLGKQHRVPAPALAESVPALIHKRSRGRFFGPKSWSGKLPFEWLSLVMLGLIVAVYVIVKLSQPALHVH